MKIGGSIERGVAPRRIGLSGRAEPPSAARLIAVFLLASILGPLSAIAEDRSDAMLRAFQDACFPHLNDLATQRQRITEAGFVQSPRAEIPGVDLKGETVVFTLGPSGVEKAVSS